MKNIIIFSAGDRGFIAYKKLRLFFNVVAYTDNNQALWGKTLNDVPIISPEELPELVKEKQAQVFICNEKHWVDIAAQLNKMGIQDYVNLDTYLPYTFDGFLWQPVSFSKPEPYRKPSAHDFAVLFVQDCPCTRTSKIAMALRERGILTYAAYTAAPSSAGERAFLEEYPIWTWTDLLDFVNQSEFDIVHCSNTPDDLVNVLLQSNKKIIYDVHDSITAYPDFNYTTDQALLEYLATTRADGVIYVTDGFRRAQLQKYRIDIGKTLVIGNYPLKAFNGIERLPKLSERDGQIHCVFEGWIPTENLAAQKTNSVFNQTLNYVPIWEALAEKGVHIHIYSYVSPEYCRSLELKSKFIHYEGNLRDEALISAMTQYDVGLLLYSEPETPLLNYASANKFTDYLFAGLPVVSNAPAYVKLLEQIGGGGGLDVAQDNIVERLKEVRKIHIPDGFCQTHGFTMNAHIDGLLAFYRSVITG